MPSIFNYITYSCLRLKNIFIQYKATMTQRHRILLVPGLIKPERLINSVYNFTKSGYIRDDEELLINQRVFPPVACGIYYATSRLIPRYSERKSENEERRNKKQMETRSQKYPCRRYCRMGWGTRGWFFTRQSHPRTMAREPIKSLIGASLINVIHRDNLNFSRDASSRQFLRNDNQ